jgi:Tol biopolymer transport system component
VVPVGRWDKARQVHYFGPGDYPGGETVFLSYYANITWSPDDTQIGFTMERGITGTTRMQTGLTLLAAVDIRSGVVATLTDERAELMDWSWDNHMAVYRKDQKRGLYDIATGTWTELPTVVQNAVALRFWGARRALLATLGDGTAALVDLDTLGVTELPHIRNALTLESGADSVQAMIGSPDGRYIAWLTLKDYEQEMVDHPYVIMVYDTVTAEQKVLLETKIGVESWSSLAWSPDGTRLAFTVSSPVVGVKGPTLRIVYLK